MQVIKEHLEPNEFGDIQASFRASDEWSACVTVWKQKRDTKCHITWYSQSGSGIAEAEKLLALLQPATEYAKGLES
jgi:hypothetical protein